jgi:hypothetical protein
VRKYVIVPVLVGLLATLALAVTATSDLATVAPAPVMGAAGSPVTLGPLSPIEQTPEMRALRSELARADASGDHSAIKAVEDRIQALYLASQPPSGEPAEAEPVPARCGVTDYGLDALVSDRVATSIAADYTMDGTMYAAAATLDSTAMVYRSTDHGVTWSALCGAQNSPLARYNKVGLVVTGGDSARIFLFFLHPGGDGDVYVARFNLDGTGFMATSVLTGADSIGDFAFCADNDNHYYLYGCAYNTSRTTGTNSSILRSTDYGVTWAVTRNFNHMNQVSYQNGAGIWQYLSSAVRLAGYQGRMNVLTNHSYGDPARWSETSVQPDTFYIEEPVFCPAFTTPETSATAWLAYHHLDTATSTYSVMTAYTQDGGATFSTPAALDKQSGAGDVWPDLKPYRSLGNDYMNISYISLLSGVRRLYRRFSQAPNPGVWSETTRVTGKEAYRSHELKPLLLYSPGGGSGGGCVFVDYSDMSRMYWNAPWQTGVAEPVAPKAAWRDLTSSLVRGVLMLEDRGRKTEDRAELLDVSGRRAMELQPGANDVSRLAPGVYFVDRGSSLVPRSRVVITK